MMALAAAPARCTLTPPVPRPEEGGEALVARNRECCAVRPLLGVRGREGKGRERVTSYE